MCRSTLFVSEWEQIVVIVVSLEEDAGFGGSEVACTLLSIRHVTATAWGIVVFYNLVLWLSLLGD
jgi:hypothetical protein